MRLFVALEIPVEVRENLAALVRELRAVDSRPSWIRAENLHVTLKFIGNAPPEKLEALHNALAGVRSPAPVALEFRGLGFFPREKKPRVFWAAMSASPNLAPLAADVESALEKIGIPRDERPFSPHLTLARFQEPFLSGELSSAIVQQSGQEFGAMRTGEFHLYESKTRPEGAQYTRLASFCFHGGS